MSFVSYLSHTRAICHRIKSTQTELPFFKGSSLNRKNNVRNPAQNESENVQTNESEIRTPLHDLPGSSENLPIWEDQTFEHCTTKQGFNVVVSPKGRTFSNRSRNKCREKIFSLFEASGSGEFTFLTLSMVNVCSDKLGASILNKFLTVLRKHTAKKFIYIWVAEHQDNGNIHFHIILNHRFPVAEINALWILQQYNAGVMNNKVSYQEITSLYYQRKYSDIQKLLNPLDIKRIHNIDSLAGYLTLYITKNKDTFGCSVWHCNRAASALFTSSIITPELFAETSDEKINRITTKKGKTYINKTFVVVNKNNGSTLALVNNIYNKTYYKKYNYELNELNKIIIGLTDEQRKNFKKEMLFTTPGEWLNENFIKN